MYCSKDFCSVIDTALTQISTKTDPNCEIFFSVTGFVIRSSAKAGGSRKDIRKRCFLLQKPNHPGQTAAVSDDMGGGGD